MPCTNEERWSECGGMKMNFTYDEYGQLLKLLIDKGYHIDGYDNYKQSKQSVILRHDIDMSLDKAVQMAQYENSIGGMRSTYFVLVSSDFYNIFSKHSMECINEIRKCGHSIGLHFDESRYFSENRLLNKEELIKEILREKKLAENMLEIKIDVVSMHIPSKRTLEEDLVIPGMINSYGKEFFKGFKYVSDSYHRWRENVWDIINKDRPQRLHILTHAFWYNAESKTRNESFLEYIEEGKEYRGSLIEKNILPPGVTLEECLMDKEGDKRV